MMIEPSLVVVIVVIVVIVVVVVVVVVVAVLVGNTPVIHQCLFAYFCSLLTQLRKQKSMEQFWFCEALCSQNHVTSRTTEFTLLLVLVF